MAVTKLVLVRHGESQWNKRTVSPAGMMLTCLKKA